MRLALTILILGCCANTATAQNLVVNSTFDTDLSWWKATSKAEWSPIDAEGSAFSGSGLTHNSSSTTTNSTYLPLVRCVPLLDGATTYEASVDALVPAGQSRVGKASAWLDWFASEDCDNSSRIGYAGGMSLRHPHGSWGTGRTTLEAPPEAAAARIYLGNRVEDEKTDDHLVYYDNVRFAPVGGGCPEDSETMCLAGGRFAVRAFWRTLQGDSGDAGTRQLSSDTGTFWFFDEANTELVVKVLDACSFSDRFWVFAGGLTDVEVELRVTDTLADETNVYRNPLGAPFQPIQDTNAFATCNE